MEAPEYQSKTTTKKTLPIPYPHQAMLLDHLESGIRIRKFEKKKKKRIPAHIFLCQQPACYPGTSQHTASLIFFFVVLDFNSS